MEAIATAGLRDVAQHLRHATPLLEALLERFHSLPSLEPIFLRCILIFRSDIILYIPLSSYRGGFLVKILYLFLAP